MTDGRSERVLVLAPTGRDSALMCSVLTRAGVEAVPCADIAQLGDTIDAGAGAVVITEEALTSATILFLIEKLEQQPPWSDLGLLILTSADNRAHADVILQTLLPLGNVTVVERPVRIVTLLSTIRSALRSRRRQYDMRDRLQERTSLLASEQAARQEAEAANRAKDEFLAVLSHELRTPLTAMLGWVHMLRSGQLDGERSAYALEIVERNTRLQARLINDLLDVSRIVAGKLQVDRHPIDLVALVRAALQSIGRDAEERGITLTSACPRSTVRILGDGVRLQQVVVNLVTNALKFTPPGGHVDVTLRAEGAEAELVVRDTGQGIEPEVLPLIFDRFHQGDHTPVRRHGGLGLGLAIVRHIVELHGGSVSAESAGRGRGAAFTVRLPRLGADVITVERHRVLREHDRLPRLDGVRVLVVDDHQDSREMVRVALEQCRADVRAASSVDDALRMLDQEAIDVLVSDLAMPDADGFDLIRHVRTRERDLGLRRTPAIALTAYASPDDEARALAAGFQVHVAKPIDPERLGAIVAATLREPSVADGSVGGGQSRG